MSNKYETKKLNNSSTKISIKVKLEHKRYYDDTKAWGVVVVSSTEEFPFAKIKEEYDIESNSSNVLYTTVIKGKMPKPENGMIWEIEASHVYEAKYKEDQYEIENIKISKPLTTIETQKYLESILTKNQSDVLLSVYPNIVDDVIKGNDNVDLDLLKGFGQATWDKTKEKIVENFAIADVLNLLIPIGVSFKKVQKLLDNEKNPQILKERLIKNPYKLTEIKGISFATADKIATQLNPNLLKSEERLVAFIQYYLEDLGESKGDTWVVINDIKSAVYEKVPEVETFIDGFIEKEKISPKVLFILDDKIGLKKYYDDEMYILESINKLTKQTSLVITEENILEGIKIAQEEQGFIFTEEQIQVIRNLSTLDFGICVGRAGVGKSSTARGVLNVYKQAGYSVGVTAFSAKAAKRAQETTGFTGQTLHKLLGIGKERNSQGGIPFDVLFVDENSLNPLFLMKEIFKAVNLKYKDGGKTKLIFCGDQLQINPLGVGNVFFDLVNKESIHKNILTKIQRQAENSGIIVDANMIREGISPILNFESKIVRGIKKDLTYLFRNDKEEIFRIAISSYIRSVKEKGVGNCALLVPFKSRGLNCTREFNKTIQRELNSENMDNKFKHGDKEFWLNDYVIHIKNNYDKEIMNGNTGFVTFIGSDRLEVTYEEDQTVEYTHEDIDELELSHAITPFKFQGSEAKDCIVVMDSSHWILLNNSYFYTSITRSKERCLVICDTMAYTRCLTENNSIRNTWLKEIN